MPSTTNREYRDMIIEVRTAETEEAPDERMIVTGYASTFNEPYLLYKGRLIFAENILFKGLQRIFLNI